MALIKLNSNSYTSGSAFLPTGSVLQVVRNYTADSSHITTTSSSFVASGFQLAITPSVVGSLLIVHFNVSMADANGSNAAMQSKMYFKTGSGSFASMAGANSYHIGFNNIGHNRYAPFCHSSNLTTTTTDAYTFEPYFKAQNSTQVRFAHNECSIGMTIFEVKQ